jgi:sugar lactone lactonase YvrE
MSLQSPVLRQNSPKSLSFLVLIFLAIFALPFQLSAQVAFTGAASSLATLPSGSTISPIAVDAAGDAFFVVSNGASNSLYKVPGGGTATVLNSSFPYSPTALAVNSAGTALYMVYTASSASCNGLTYQRVSMVSTAANATPADLPQCFTFGSPTSYSGFYSDPVGLAVDSSSNLYVDDFGGGVIWKIPGTVSSTSIPTTYLNLNIQSNEIAIYGGTLYFAAYNFSTSQYVLYSAATSQFTANILAGAASSSSLVNIPSSQNGLVADSNGNIYIGTPTGVDEYSGGSLTTVSTATAGGTTGVAVDSSNNLYFAGTDSSGNPVVATQSAQSVNFHSVNIGSTSGTVSLGFKIGASASTTVGSVHIYTQGAGGLDFADAGSSTCTAKTYSSSTNCVINVKFTPRAAGLRSGAVVLSDSSGNTLGTVYVYGTGVGPQVAFGPGVQSTITSGLNAPGAMAVDASGNVYIADTNNNRVLKEPWTGSSYGTQSTVGTGLNSPAGVAVDGAGNVYIGDESGLIKVPWTGSGYGTQTTIGSGLSSPSGVAVDGSGNVYIADWGHNRLVKEPWTGSSYGAQSSVIGSGLNAPFGVAVDGSGNVYVADMGNSRVLKAAWTGSGYSTPTTVGSGLDFPVGVAVDGGGNVYIADSGNSRVVREPWTGSSFGTQATLGSGWSSPEGVVVDGGGNVYIADATTNSAVKVDLADAPSFTFATTPVGVESSDSPKSVTMFNVGNASLTFPIPASGKNPTISSGFASDPATTCPELTTSSSAGSLGQGASCVYAVDFIPAASGAASGSLVMKDNNLNAAGPSYTTQSISLSGTGQLQIALSPSSLTAGMVGIVYSQTITASGGTSPYTFAVTAGSLPAGVTLSSSGALSGTPTAGGTFNFTIGVTDTASKTASQAYTLTVNAPTITLLPISLPSPSVGTAYSQTVTASGGTAPFSYAVTAGSLPAGMTLSSAGVLSGTPTAAGTFNFTVTATDSSTGTGPYTGSRAYALTVSAPTITVSPTTMPSATVAASYSQSISAAGGTGPYTFAVSAGSLPAGLSLSSAGILSGTPTAGGSFTFTVRATDSTTGTGAPFSGSRAFTLTVNAPTVTVSPTTLPGGTYNAAYSQTLAASGGTSPYSFSVSSGSLPNGLTLSSAGVVSGTPTAAGTFTFAATATDSSTGTGPYTGSQAYTTVISKASQTITFAAPSSPVTYGVAPITLTASASSSLPVAFSVVSGPATVSGNTLTITGAGTVVVAVDQAGNTNYTAAAQKTASLVVNQASQTITFTPPASPVSYGVAPIALSATATSGLAANFSVLSGPATVSGNTLTITGVGTVVVAANQAGNTNYTAASQVTASIVVNQASQTITFTPPASPVTYGVSPIALSATATSGLPVTFSLVSGPATLNGSTLTITGAGAVVVAANQTGNTNYTAASQVMASIVVNQAPQTITFTPPASPVKYGVSPIALSATATSGLPVTFSLVSGPATLSGSTLTITGSGTVVVAANQVGNTNYTAAPQVTQSVLVGQTGLSVAANNFSRIFGTANPPFTGAVTGAVYGDTFSESFATTASVASNTGTYAIVPSVTGSNLADYTVTVQDGTLTITQAGSSTLLGVSSASITPGQSVTLTAQVASATSGTPTGTVSFYDGTTLLGTSPLTAGSAALTTSSLSAGATHVITAAYDGDINFTASSTTASTSIAVAALDFTMTLSGPTSQTVVPGNSADFHVVIDPLYGSYAGPLSFSVTGLPPGATVSINPTTIAPNGGKQTVTVSIQTAGVVAAMQHSAPVARRLAPLALGMLLLPFVGARRMRKQGRRLHRLLVLLLLIGGMATAVTLSGCGSRNGFFTQPQKSYDVTITASAGSLTHTATFTIQVQ